MTTTDPSKPIRRTALAESHGVSGAGRHCFWSRKYPWESPCITVTTGSPSVLVLVSSHFMHGMLIGFHEASHGLLRKSRLLNEIDGVLIGVLSFMSFSLYRAAHQIAPRVSRLGAGRRTLAVRAPEHAALACASRRRCWN